MPDLRIQQPTTQPQCGGTHQEREGVFQQPTKQGLYQRTKPLTAQESGDPITESLKRSNNFLESAKMGKTTGQRDSGTDRSADQGYELWGEPHATAAPSLKNSGKLEALRIYYRKDFPDTEGTACPSLGILENRTEAGKHLQDRELFLGFEYPRFHRSVCSRPHQLPGFPLQWLHYPETGQSRT